MFIAQLTQSPDKIFWLALLCTKNTPIFSFYLYLHVEAAYLPAFTCSAP